MTAEFVPGTIVSSSPERARRQVGAWLMLCAALVLSIAVVGGVTRLTHSGLSMVTWEPLTGILPPMGAEAWEEEFSHYREFPEYQLLNRGMDLEGFKSIYWLEYSHRLLARFIGVVYAVPFVVFLSLGWLERQFAWRLFGLLILGAMQAVMGWMMVASGLVERPDVSHYRLTAHLGLAALIWALLIWLALRVLLPQAVGGIGAPVPRGFRRMAITGTILVFVLILSGGLVAGLDAGFAYNTFPTMEGRWMPEGLLTNHPFETVASVQFWHRWLGLFVGAYLVVLWGLALDVGLPKPTIWAFHFLLAVVTVQGLLGILTLLQAVPIVLAATHQGMALIVLGAAVIATYLLGMSRVAPGPGITVVN